MKKTLIISGIVIFGIILLCILFIAIGYFRYMDVTEEVIDQQCTLYTGGGGNSLVLTTRDGTKALLVDTKMGRAAKKLRTMITAEVVMVVNTHAHKNHSGGNGLFPGTQLIAGSYAREQWKQLVGESRYPDEIIEPGKDKYVHFDDELVRIRNMGPAHSWNDCVVYLKNRKLLMTGDLVFVDMHPALFPEKGTSVGAWIAVLDTLPALFDIKTVVPGHGQKSGKVALRTMKEYFTSIRGALGDPTALKKLKDGYSSYYSLPGLSSFDITVATLNAEKKQ